MIRDALISADGLYRYTLTRQWDEKSPWCVFVMLNPSTADAEVDDPTIRRCVDFGKLWDCGGIKVVNLFAFRATDPYAIVGAADPVGPDNDRVIGELLGTLTYRHIVVAWGATNSALPVMKSRVKSFWNLHFGNDGYAAGIRATRKEFVKCLGVTQSGNPRHPLYVRRSAPLVPWGAM